MKKAASLIACSVLFVCVFGASAFASFLNAPHNGVNGISCFDCHEYPLAGNTWPPDFPPANPTEDDTLRNFICLRCHGPQGNAPTKAMHSSLSMFGVPGWTTECVDCHDPHFQGQLARYQSDGASLYLITGVIDGITVGGGTTVIDYGNVSTKAEWSDPATWNNKTGMNRGLIFVADKDSPYNTFEILSADGATITLDGEMDASLKAAIEAAIADPLVDPEFGVIYGQLLRKAAETPTGVERPFKFFDPNGGFTDAAGNPAPGGFIDESGSGAPEGICQVCHTQTKFYTSDGGGSSHYTGNCRSCHNPSAGFAHGGGSGTGCVECHGHDAGTFYDPDMQAPYTPGVTASQGRGTYQSHSTHTELDSDDVKGPGIYCNTCHDINNFPYFKSGTDVNGDGMYDLAETDVCNTCHSKGGSYDGLDDPVVGAKVIWHTGAYVATDDSTLAAGKEKWCATCHDEVPSVIQAVSAPNVIGDENGAYTYGTGWGFYRTGHGLSGSESYPASGGVTAGAGAACDACHDFSAPHIDGLARTFDDGDSPAIDPGVYRQGYRLKLVGGKEPMLVPWPQNTANSPDNYRLCMSCHSSGAFTDSQNMNTNMVTDGVNRHAYHLGFNMYAYAADWSGSNTSLINCVACHNVHGSTRLAMVRDGKLTGREPGLMMWYNNDAIVTNQPTNPDPPEPENLPLSASTGTIWRGLTSGTLCSHCHGNDNTVAEYRAPFQSVEQGPALSWTGESGYVDDGVGPDSGAGGSTFIFRVRYTDTNNDAPVAIELWADQNDNGTYEAEERYAMTATDSGDAIFTDGKLYTRSLVVRRAGDDSINYRFYASDGTLDASGPPAAGGAVVLTNNAPVLGWTGEAYFTGDGVSPDTGGSGFDFEFRVNYTDADNNAPTLIEVWVDENDDGVYEAGEIHDLVEVNSGDTNFSDGKLYALTLPLAHAGDGRINYRFQASDGLANATGEPTLDSVVTVNASSNTPPFLDWVSAACRSKGVQPAFGADGADFEFSVRYTDPDNQCPSGAGAIQVWIDENDNGSYEADERYDLSEDDGSDTNCADGKLYGLVRPLFLAGDNTFNYRFHASDGTDAAVGEPAGDAAVTVVDALKVRPAGGTGWHGTIQAAIDAVDNDHVVLVYPGTYNENIYFDKFVDHSTTVRSVCGPDSAIVNGTGHVVEFLENSGSVVDGFQITGGSTGIWVNASTPAITNSRIHGNASGGIYEVNSTLTLDQVEIHDNSAANGAGIFFNGGANHAIADSIIRNNTATGDFGGGAVFVQNTSLSLSGTAILDNSAAGRGGGIYSNGANVQYHGCTMAGNLSSGIGGAMYLTSAASTAYVENSVIAGNRGSEGGAVFTNGGPLTIINSTVADNRATSGNGGAFRTSNTTAMTVRNSILWGNLAAGAGHIAYFNGGTLTVSDSIIASGNDGVLTNAPYIEGNIGTDFSGYLSENDPFFVDSAHGDYHIEPVSDAVDHASAAYAPVNDIDDDSRPQGGADDIGADEYAAPEF